MTETPLRLGWEEWVALPGLGLPAIKVKVDTGAKTSALHASDIEPFGSADHPKVRFLMHPIPARPEIAIACSADVVDRREVTSSNGETEFRYVIGTDLSVGGRHWPVELTLTDRGTMAYRMLLGRQAFGDEVVVVPNGSFCQPQLDYDVYSSPAVRAVAPDRALRVAILSREGDGYTTARLVEEGTRRGHTVEVIDTLRCYMALNALAPEIHYDGKRLPMFDAVIPRIGPSVAAYGAAIVRQFETIGTWCVNPSDGITASRDKLHAHQILARARIDMPATAFASSPKDSGNLMALVGRAPLVLKLLDTTHGQGTVLAETDEAAHSVMTAFRGLRADFLVQTYVEEAAGEEIRCLVMDGKIAASIRRRGAAGTPMGHASPRPAPMPVKIKKAEREIALRAARAFRLGLAAVDIIRTKAGPKVIEVHATPGLERIETALQTDLCAVFWDAVERRARPAPVRRSRRTARTGSAS